jgi:hypothetical protein
MKKDLSTLALLVLLLFIVSIPVFAQQTYKFRPPSNNEEDYGTWVNEKYSGGAQPQKFVDSNWGYGEAYDRISDKTPSLRYTFFFVDKWTDASGNVWYKQFCQISGGGRGYYLIRISQGGKVLEEVVSSTDFPTKLDPNSSSYYIYYRPKS